MAFAERAPSGMNTVDDVGFAIVGALEDTLSVIPPAGAGWASVIGSEAVPAKGTFSVLGIE